MAYEEAMCAYFKTPAHKYLKKGWQDDWRWKKVAELAKACHVSCEVFIKAQFWFCDTVLGRAPKQQELTYVNTKVPCSKRLQLYLEAVGRQEVSVERDTVN